MSDSDDLARDVYTFQNESTMVSGIGPSGNFSTTGLSFRSNLLSSTKQMAPNLEGQRLAEASYQQNQPRHRYIDSRYGQPSFNNRREVSPFSTRSMHQLRQRNDNYTLNPQRMSSARSVISHRAVSPMSMRSADTTASCLSAVDIANCFKYGNYNKQELKLIKESYDRYIKIRLRTKIRKRSYHRSRRRISDDEGRESSTSSDDRSARTTNNNMSSCRSMVTDISNFRRTIQNSNILKDCSNTFKCNSVRSEIRCPVNLQSSIMSSRSTLAWRNMPKIGNCNNTNATQAPPIILQKERFANGFQFPSQRFNKSAISKSITENVIQNNCRPQRVISSINKNSARSIATDSDGDDIFSNSTKRNTQKRNIDCVDHNNIHLPTQKRQKTLSPCKNNNEAANLMASNNKDDADDFVFAKPTFLSKRPVKQKWITKSAESSSDNFSKPLSNPPVNIQARPEEDNKDTIENEETNSTQNSTNVSMRPSFIKRKLFSQKANFSEQINTSADSLNSPQNTYSVTKEKHKARKLQQVMTQSCLNRDIQQDNNLLDLIHKIVPIDQMNITNQTNKTDRQSKNKSEENDKWDVTSIISASKADDDLSETFTDEEILNSTVRILQKETNPNINKRKEDLQEKVPEPITAKTNKNVVKQNTTMKPSPTKQKSCKVVLHKISFWDTDFESDAEYQSPYRTDNFDAKENRNSRLDVHPKVTPRNAIFSKAFNLTKSSAAPSTSAAPGISSLNAFLTLEKTNNTSCRPVRSCRLSRNVSADRSNLSLNQTLKMTLRSRKKFFYTDLSNESKSSAAPGTSSLNAFLTLEKTNNTSCRPVRSCRLSRNVSADRSNLSLNQTLKMTLRSRKKFFYTNLSNESKWNESQK